MTAQGQSPRATSPVASVNGHTGSVVLSSADVGAASASSLAGEVSRAQSAEASKANSSDLSAEVVRATNAESLSASKSANLSDLASPSVALTNLGGTALSSRGRENLITQNSLALKAAYAGLANREFAPFNVLIVGDSKTEGMGATTANNRSVAKFGQRLRLRFPTTGAPGPAHGVNWIEPYTESTTLAGPFTVNTLSKNTLYGIGRKTAQINSSIGPLTSNSAAGLFTGLTSFRLAYHQTGSAGNIGVQVNGGAVTNVNANGAGAEKLSSSFALTGGTDSIVLSHVSGTTNYIEGLQCFNGDEAKGIGIYPAGHFGWTSQQWLDNSVGDGLGLANWTPWIGLLSPSLVIIRLFSNDWFNAVSPTVAQTNLETFVNTINTAASTAGVNLSILLVGDTQRSGIANAYTWSQYISAALAVAGNHTNTALFDLNLRMPPVAGDSLGLFYDTVHASNKGQSLEADALVDFLSPR